MAKPASMESQCDALIRSVFGPSAIVRLGTKGKRTRNTDGVPDRLYCCRDRIVFFEIKSTTDYLSPQQEEFLAKMLLWGVLAGCGGREELYTLLRSRYPVQECYVQIAKYRTRAGRT